MINEGRAAPDGTPAEAASSRWMAAAVVAVIAVGVSACGGAANQSAPELAPGQDACGHCFMIINELRYAAGYVDADGMPHGFDDIACMIAWLRQNDDAKPTPWVCDYETGRWTHANEAWYVRSARIKTPMAGGIVAFADHSSADQMAERMGGSVRRWPDVVSEGTRNLHPNI